MALLNNWIQLRCVLSYSIARQVCNVNTKQKKECETVIIPLSVITEERKRAKNQIVSFRKKENRLDIIRLLPIIDLE
jgi:hypothetical protein